MNSLKKFLSETPLMVMVYTGCIFFMHLAYGMNTNMLGPAMIDMKYIYDTTDLVMFYGVSISATGYTIGSFVGWFYQWLNRQLLLVFFLALMAVCSTMQLFGAHLWLLFALMLGSGLGSGAWDSSTNVWLVEMWPSHSSAFLQASQFIYGVGTFLGPLMVTPFVFGEDKNKTLPDGTNYTVHHSAEERRHSLLFPFVSVGVLMSIVPVIFLVTYFCRPYERPGKVNTKENIDDTKQPSPIPRRRLSSVSLRGFPVTFDGSTIQSKDLSTKGEKHVPYRLAKLALAGLTNALYGTLESLFLIFLSPALQYLPVELSAPAAAIVVSLTSFTYTFGRLVTTFISLRLSADTILIYHFGITVVSLLGMYIASMHSISWLIYLSATLIGFGFSSIWPGLFSWTEHHLKLTDRVNASFSFLFGFFGLSFTLLLGTQLKDNPVFIYYLTATLLAGSSFTFALVKLLVHLTPPRSQ